MTAVRRIALPRSSTATPQEVAEFIDHCFGRFDDAYEENGRSDRVRLAGRAVHVRYAAPGLRARFLPALRHLTEPGSDGSAAELTICCWDGSTTAVSLPPPPWRPVDFVGQARIRGHIAGPLIASYDPDGRLLQLFDRPGRRALFHVADGRDLPGWHDRSPFRPFVSLWADDEKLALLHGAAVAQGGAAVVLAGRSGSGKSTTAMACLMGGMEFLGDDACLADPAGGVVSSVYGRAKVEPDAGALLGPLDRLGALSTDSEGATVVTPAWVGRDAHLRAVLLVEVSGDSGTELSASLPPEPAIAALVDTVEAENKGVTPAAIEALAALVDAIPVRRLAVGTDLAGVVQTIRGLLT